jgi:hypothetical protein
MTGHWEVKVARSLVDARISGSSHHCGRRGVCAGPAGADHGEGRQSASHVGKDLLLVHDDCGFYRPGHGWLSAGHLPRARGHLQLLHSLFGLPRARSEGTLERSSSGPWVGLGCCHPLFCSMPDTGCVGSDPARIRAKLTNPGDCLRSRWHAHFRKIHVALHASADGENVLVVRSSAGNDRQLHCCLDSVLTGHNRPYVAWSLVVVDGAHRGRHTRHHRHDGFLSAEVLVSVKGRTYIIASACKIETDAIAVKVKQEFAAEGKIKKAAQTRAKATKKAARQTGYRGMLTITKKRRNMNFCRCLATVLPFDLANFSPALHKSKSSGLRSECKQLRHDPRLRGCRSGLMISKTADVQISTFSHDRSQGTANRRPSCFSPARKQQGDAR